mgnify:CR=1 FL=1
MEKINEKISSLEEYISIIKKYKLSNQYFRGENQKYEGITSSLIRSYNPKEKNIGLIEIYTELLNAYYQEVGYNLDKQQDENFLAFSQHHGLKTNLIDFTTAPLVALYFACERKEYNVDCGFVYVLKKDDTVDASKFLREYSIKEHLCYNVFEQLKNKKLDVIHEFTKLITAYVVSSDRNPNNLIDAIIKQIYEYPQLKRCNLYLKEKHELDKEIVLMCQQKNGLEKLEQGNKIQESLQLIRKYVQEIDELGMVAVNEFVGLLILFLKDLSMTTELPPQLEFPSMPYFIYKTPLKFDRINNQNGVFLYQVFVDYGTDYEVVDGLMTQKIKPNIVIQIDNQKEIMKELDMVGINRKYIYGDFDSTAQYINMKFF